ncbi:MAG: response regulator [Sandaracinaceae bacterium]|nr:response regulator [Sandaracinaceae bacterium]
MRRVHPQARGAAEDAGRAEDPPGSVACDPRAEAQALGSASRRVLLVDDNCDSIELLAEYLRRAGHEVVVAYDPSAALAAAGAQAFDAVFVDVGLPGDGRLRARAAPERDARARAAAVRPHGLRRRRHARPLRGRRVRGHLTKPADPKAIAAILRS